MNETKKVSEKKVGPIVATLIIVLVLIIAALYLFASKVNQPAIPNDTVDTMNAGSTGNADLDALRSDLNNSTADLDKHNF